MSRLALLLSFAFASAVVTGIHSASFNPPPWAFGAGEKGKPYPDDGQPKRLAGSARTYTFKQIEDSFAPADGFPNDPRRCLRSPSRQVASRTCARVHGAICRMDSAIRSRR